MKNKRRKVVILLAFFMVMQLCSFSFSPTSVAIDTENKRVYEYCVADQILSEFVSDERTAKDKYNGNYYLVSGKINSMKKKGNGLVLGGISSDFEKIIKCSCSDKEIKSDILEFAVGDNVSIFGKMSIDVIDKDIHLSVEKIIKTPSATKSSASYFLLDGSNIDYNTMISRTLNNGGVTYYIPSQWKQVEYNISGEDIGTIEGYQYVLNKISGSADSVPESFFVCYFNNKEQLADFNDAKETKLIEKAIIKNISGNVGKFPAKEVKTYYGTKYQYYLGKYTDILETGSGYHVEYVFQQDSNEGVIIYLYVYKESKHISDIMFVTRFLEIS